MQEVMRLALCLIKIHIFENGKKARFRNAMKSSFFENTGVEQKLRFRTKVPFNCEMLKISSYN